MKVVCPRADCVWGKDGLCIRIKCPYTFLLPQRGAAANGKSKRKRRKKKKGGRVDAK